MKSVIMVSCAVLCKKEGMANYFRYRTQDFYLLNVIPKFLKTRKPVCEHYKDGKLIEVFSVFSMPVSITDKFPYASYIGYALAIIQTFIKLRRRFEFFIGEGHIYSLVGVLMKKLGLVKRIAYSSGDYFTDVKSFRVIDKIVSKEVDVIWCASELMSKQREKDLNGIRFAPQVVMPLGIVMRDEAVQKKIQNAKTVLFMGNIQPHQGIDLMIDSFAEARKAYPNLTLEIVGRGPYTESAQQKVSDAGLSSCVIFHGFVDDENKVDEIYKRSLVGMALYHPELSSFTKLSDPGKIKDYLSAGLPVITTNVFPFSKELAESGAGIVVSYEKGSVVDALKRILNPNNAEVFRGAALKLANKYLWDLVLDRTLEQTN
ncbi:MAG: glycosyltransferase [Patescibacteria group bacterium]